MTSTERSLAVPPASELRGWARLAAGVADRAVVGTVQDMHRAISDGAYRWVGPIGRPLQVVQDAATDRVYGTVRATIRGAGEVGAALADHVGVAPDTPPSPGMLKARAIAHGVLSDDMIALAPELDLDVSLRHRGRELDVSRGSLRRTHPGAGGRVTVFVHGLVDTEAVWSARHAADDGSSVSLPDVASGLGTTSVFVRYGTGRAIGRNGEDLANLLEELVAAWPVEVTRLVVVGHSMGGLVARAACATAEQRGHAWTEVLTDIVYLGCPHLGSWLEKASNVGTWILRCTSRSAPIGSLIDGRSRGIKDLRWGTLVEAGWGETAIDDLLTGLVPDEPWAEGVTHHLVAGRLRRGDRHPWNVVFGDSLVRAGSAAGVGRRRRITGGGEVVVVPVVSRHSGLVHHPEVAALLRGVLGRPARRGAAAAG